MFLTKYFRYFVFIELFDLNSNFSNLIEIQAIIDFLVGTLVDFSVSFLLDLVIKICVIKILLKTLNLSLAGVIFMNLQ